MIVVADTGPIIALATLDRIDLLGVFGADILVPPCVRRMRVKEIPNRSDICLNEVGWLRFWPQSPPGASVVRR
ncbi:putative nucleic acid-binding protein [Salinibacter ruber]|uniref:Nucleic acid-binding protein n=1 Tax=Salinibacter ruber TaxID=146919 RepID=A0A9X2UB89_9BACT|nr:hypothetical protein [Salinibacter ruber]MCS3628927.1 putative nucleic acid-binding protein [Salinibacter ruber]MCS3827462.1 putative nucleic acid-binding protein [Salinibacter ruber]MCS3953289.1 putative nucleic acid-binding protein [Salinibacter ruber]MCS4145836.1 putative nucleic acid-binding protein [Salinibacter ruber]MCS4194456.1 putative nucleic acid-binding protein [Salinibacter ruber]